jgi:hypothetical protein
MLDSYVFDSVKVIGAPRLRQLRSRHVATSRVRRQGRMCTRAHRIRDCDVPDGFKAAVPLCFSNGELSTVFPDDHYASEDFGPGTENSTSGLRVWHW